ncbi:MAG: large conductance mechanosensitive channel protein MscL [Erysipelotrichaceae bacterium]|nr:large conductance mechanosensitive channel protein MscL [Erysipelotrichaceae bacterium]
MKKFFSDFKKFISKGNVLDLAVAVVMGNAFTAIVNSLVKSIIMPFICAIFGQNSVADLAFTLNGTPIPYGVFIQAIIDFLLIAFTLFVMLRLLMNAKGLSNKIIKDKPNRSERKELKAMGINLKDRQATLKATKELRESKIVKVESKPTTEQLLSEILAEIKKK